MAESSRIRVSLNFSNFFHQVPVVTKLLVVGKLIIAQEHMSGFSTMCQDHRVALLIEIRDFREIIPQLSLRTHMKIICWHHTLSLSFKLYPLLTTVSSGIIWI